MENPSIETIVEAYLNKQLQSVDIDFNSQNSYECFKLRTVKRLFTAFDLFCGHKKFKDDFLIALRDYLIVYKTDIMIDGLEISSDNKYGLIRDDSTGKYFVSKSYPAYTNGYFVDKAFQLEPAVSRPNNKNYSLFTDPLIYKITGFKSFKSVDQKIAVYGALDTPDGYTSLVSLPTGGGKSLITQTMAYQKEGLTIVVVPTVSLAIDQERAAKYNIKTDNPEEEIFSYSSGVNAVPILNAIRAKKARLLFISPESLLNNQAFNNVINEANSSRYLKNIIIDEAHIVVDWGASFRVDYQCLESWRRRLMISNPMIRTILLSATFEERCIRILKSLFSTDEKWIEIRCDSLRHEPHYMLIKAKSRNDKTDKMLELVRKMPHPMIIYVAKPDEAESIKKLLVQNGINNVRTFTGLTNNSERKKRIEEWVDDKYEIMVATSAFGVGVDKSDVRTVLHMYVPSNPNAYYQELGRGGRDRLPCLSIMCMIEDDVDTAFERIKKKVMTPEKIIGRWNSMYNNINSVRINNLSYIDTSIKPDYHEKDLLDDSPVSEVEKNWNIYVLLLLRRFNLIKIHEVLVQSDKYIFVIEIIDSRLLNNDNELKSLISEIRSDEWDYNYSSYNLMKNAIANSKKACWTEMFYETYEKVSEHCSGCDHHNEVVGNDFLDFPLKKTIREPVKRFEADQIQKFGNTKNSIVYSKLGQSAEIINRLIENRVSGVVYTDRDWVSDLVGQISARKNVIYFDIDEFKTFVKKKNYYYVSGYIVVDYKGTPRDIYHALTSVLNCVAKVDQIKLIHLIEENVYFDWLGKSFADFIDGPVLSCATL